MFAGILLALLIVPAHAGVDLRWAPVLGETLPKVDGPAREIARGFDATVFEGLELRINEIQVLAQYGVRDLGELGAFRRRPDAASYGVELERLAALERSLKTLAPVVARLEAGGTRLDDSLRLPENMTALLCAALIAEADAAERKAGKLASSSAANLAPEQALANSKEIDALLRDRHLYLSVATLVRLTRVYDSDQARIAAARAAQAEPEQFAFVSPQEQLTMRDAVAAPPARSFFRRVVAVVRAAVRSIAG
jgi:exonuclease VII small subunit